MPGDSMELSVDFRTQRAAQNAQALNAELDKMAASTAAAARVVYTLDTAADKLAESESKAAKSATALGAEVTKAGTAAEGAKQKFEQSGGAIRSAMDGIAKGTESVSNQVKNWVAGYAGLSGALHLLRQYIQYQEKIIQNQKEFATTALTRDQALEAVQSNLQLGFTPAGQSKARDLVQAMADKTSLSFENAAVLISSVNAAGFKPLTKAGAASSEALGKYAGLAGLNGQEIEGLSRLISNQGIQGDPRAVQGFLGRLYSTFTKTDTTSQPAFINAAIPTLNLAREKGMEQTEALGMMSAYLSTAATPDQGMERMRMMLRMGEGATPKIAGVMARKARELGITTGGMATMADVEAMAAGGDADKKGKLERLRDMESGLIPMETAISEADIKLGQLQKPAGTAKKEEARVNSLRLETERRSEAIRRRDERKHDIALTKQSAVEEVQAERDMATFQGLSISNKTQLLQRIFRDVKGPGGSTRDRNILIAELGGRPELMAAVEAASGVVFGEKQAIATAAARDPTASGRLATEMENRKIANVAGAVAANESAERMAAAEGGPETQFALQSEAISEKAYQIGTKTVGAGSQFFGPTGTYGTGLGLTEDARKARYLRASAYVYVRDLYNVLTTEEKGTYGNQLTEIQTRIYESESDPFGANQIVHLHTAFLELGRLRSEIMAKRQGSRGGGAAKQIFDVKVRAVNPFTTKFRNPREPATESEQGGGGGSTGIGPSTQPSTGPGGSTSVNYNVNVGNYFSTSGADAELTGRLEGTG